LKCNEAIRAVSKAKPRVRMEEVHEKKDCLFLTNEAVMLLKTKDRQNERSRTNPILLRGKASQARTVESPLRIGLVPSKASLIEPPRGEVISLRRIQSATARGDG
jgi:hypothetical protein